MTEGHPIVNDIVTVEGVSQEDFLYFAGSAQKQSGHPFSEAVIKVIEKRNIALSEDIKNFEAVGARCKSTGGGPMDKGGYDAVFNQGKN